MRRSRALPAIFIASLVVAGGAAPQALAACKDANTVPTAENLRAIRAAFVCLHNRARRSADVRKLRSQRRLTRAAHKHARHMVRRDYFSHESPSGRGPFQRMRRAGYIRRGFAWNAGELIAWATGSEATPRRVMRSWLRRGGQRATVLAPDFKHIGIGVAIGAPFPSRAGAMPAVTYTVDYGWRRRARGLRACVRRAQEQTGRAARQSATARCHGLGRG